MPGKVGASTEHSGETHQESDEPKGEMHGSGGKHPDEESNNEDQVEKGDTNDHQKPNAPVRPRKRICYDPKEKIKDQKYKGAGLVRTFDNGKDFNFKYIQEHGFSRPLLFLDKEGLGRLMFEFYVILH